MNHFKDCNCRVLSLFYRVHVQKLPIACNFFVLIFSVEVNKEKLDDLLQFWTGNPTIPLGDSKLVVTSLEANPSKVLPEANTCAMVLHIPTIHQSYQDFKANMDKAISYSKIGFGKM